MKTLLILMVSLFLPIQVANSKSEPQQLQQQVSLTPEVAKVLKQVHKNNPNLEQKFARNLATTIVNKAKKYQLQPRILAAILMQESSYRIEAKNIRCGVSISTGKEDCVVIDYGIGQINHKTIKAFNFNKKKLLSDLEYSIEASAIVLADFKRTHGKKEVDYWSRYNSGDKEKRQVYKNLVARYL